MVLLSLTSEYLLAQYSFIPNYDTHYDANALEPIKALRLPPDGPNPLVCPAAVFL